MLKYSVHFYISPGGEVVNAAVCKTATRGFESHPGLTCTSKLPFARVVESVGEIVWETIEQGLTKSLVISISLPR